MRNFPAIVVVFVVALPQFKDLRMQRDTERDRDRGREKISCICILMKSTCYHKICLH